MDLQRGATPSPRSPRLGQSPQHPVRESRSSGSDTSCLSDRLSRPRNKDRRSEQRFNNAAATSSSRHRIRRLHFPGTTSSGRDAQFAVSTAQSFRRFPASATTGRTDDTLPPSDTVPRSRANLSSRRIFRGTPETSAINPGDLRRLPDRNLPPTDVLRGADVFQVAHTSQRWRFSFWNHSWTKYHPAIQ